MTYAPWERALLLMVAHEVGCWDRGEASPYVAMHNIASFVRVPVKPYREPKPRKRRKSR